ncbi:MAG: twin-arginine translocase TatA/TatE family subunit [Candidatus Omnitrophica bacterium]|nr:twin-arginine translocase TatA/TatE family subunit [Candidatus Omnitrophota bacterium]
MFGLGVQEPLVIFSIILLVLGAAKVPGMGRVLRKVITDGFKKAKNT